MKKIHLLIYPEIHQKISEQAKELGISMSDLMRIAISKYIKEKDRLNTV